MLYVNTESFFKLSSGLFVIFLMANATDTYMYEIGSFAVEKKIHNLSRNRLC